MTFAEGMVAGSRAAARRHARGFTLLELMVTVTVAGVIFTLGVPSFVDLVRNNRAATNVNELLTAFSIARSEAIRRGWNITVCRSSDGVTCGDDWADGWIIFRDDAATDTSPPDEPASAADPALLRTWPAMPGSATVTTFAAGASADVEWVRFTPRGGMRADGAMPIRYDVELDGCSGQQMRRVILNTVGHATVTREAC
jgi:type IV fimbrial biogenesis protein FimT